jgi:ubiquinol-cytochrome c reductase cytochrome c subunit
MTARSIIAIAAAFAALAGAASAQDVARGKALYFTNGCYGCHGFTGQTGVRNLVGTKSPNLASPEAFTTFLRARANVQPMTPSSSMPSFPAKALSNAQAHDIYAYIKTFKLDAPEMKDVPVFAAIQASAAAPYKPGK